MTPGNNLVTASMTRHAATSPPANTTSPMEISPSTRCSRTRWSTPSYRPHNRLNPFRLARCSAVRCVKGEPPGPRRRSGRAGLTASTASKIGSGRISIPAPPPNGASSTVRCTSCVWSRRSWQESVTTPESRALPSKLAEQNSSTIDGNTENTSIRMTRTLLSVVRAEQPWWQGHDDDSVLLRYDERHRNEIARLRL